MVQINLNPEVLAPSNIAIIKYWGKTFYQIPMNPSLSMTLNFCQTSMTADIKFQSMKNITVSRFVFAGTENLTFAEKLQEKCFQLINFLEQQKNIIVDASIDQIVDLNLVQGIELSIHSHNTFPHSAGIASSASSMAAFAKILAPFFHSEKMSEDQKVSCIARLLSGSACRSLHQGWVSWGKTSDDESSNLWAHPLTSVHPTFQTMLDWIFIVDQNEKKVSSSLGHKKIEQHHYRSARILNAKTHYQEARHLLELPVDARFFELMEAEALELHALMMTSTPPFILMKPTTLVLIDLFIELRVQHKVLCGFTLDAGANIHLLFPSCEKQHVDQFINSQYFKNKLGCEIKIIKDYVCGHQL